MRLLELAKKVVALEIDPRMAAEVKKRAQTAGERVCYHSSVALSFWYQVG